MTSETPKPAPSDTDKPADESAEKPIPTLWEQMGGAVGFISASVPVAVFVIVNVLTSMWPAIWSALGTAVLIGIYRIARKQQLMPAISGVFGVAIAAFIAYKVGSAKGFFLYGIWVSGVFGSAFLISMIVRWPLAGVIWSTLNGHGFGWRADKKSRTYYDIATAVWTLVFAARVIVQQWLYNADEATLLGIARLAMGYPLTIIAVLVTIWAIAQVSKRDKIREQAARLEAEDDAEVERQLRAKYDTPAQESP